MNVIDLNNEEILHLSRNKGTSCSLISCNPSVSSAESKRMLAISRMAPFPSKKEAILLAYLFYRSRKSTYLLSINLAE